MRKAINQLWMNQIFRGTSIFFVGNIVVGGLAFLYHWIMPRLLGPIEYGILASLFGLIYIEGVPMNALDFLVTKLVSGFEQNEVLHHTKSLMYYLSKKMIPVAGVIFLLAIGLSGLVRDFLHLPDTTGVTMVWLIVAVSVAMTIGRSILRGLLRFQELVINQFLEMSLRLLFAVLLVTTLSVWYGWGLVGVISASLVALIVIAYQLRDLMKVDTSPFEHHQWGLKRLGLGSLVMSLAYTLMYSVDVLLVKHYFSNYWTGIYAVLVTAGKVVFFAQSPLTGAMVPTIARKAKHPEQARRDLWLLLGIMLIISVIIVGCYGLFSQQLVKLIFTEKFLPASSLLMWMGVALASYSFANLGANFLLALDKHWSAWLSLGALGVEIASIVLFHSSLDQVVLSLVTIFGILATILIAYCFYVTRPTVNSNSSI